MEKIARAVFGVMESLEAKRKLQERSDPLEALNNILTKKELGHIKFNYFKAGVLSLNIDSSAWLYQISLKKNELLEALGRQLPGVKDLKLRLGDIK